MSLFGTTPVPARGDCQWKNETGMRFGDKLPPEMQRQPTCNDKKFPIRMQELLGAAGPHRGSGALGGHFEENYLDLDSTRTSSKPPRPPRAQSAAAHRHDSRKRPLGSPQTRSHISGSGASRRLRPSTAKKMRQVQEMERELAREVQRRVDAEACAEHLRSTIATLPGGQAPQSTTTGGLTRARTHVGMGSAKKAGQHEPGRPISAQLERNMAGPAVHTRPAGEWRPAGTQRLRPEAVPGPFPVTAARICEAFSDATDTGDIPGHSTFSTNAVPIQHMLHTMEQYKKPLDGQDVAQLGKHMHSKHIPPSSKLRLTQPAPQEDPRMAHPKPYMLAPNPTGFSSQGRGRESFYIQELGNSVRDFGSHNKPRDTRSPYIKAFLHGQLTAAKKPPPGYMWCGVHSGRFQQGEPTDDGQTVLQKRRLPLAARSAVAALLGMEGTTDVSSKVS